MSNQMEIEFKNLLTEKEYQQMMAYFHVTDDQCWEQENHYYDTPDFKLKSMRSALRIRILPETAEMTLKTPFQGFLLESTDLISRESALKMTKGEKIIPFGDVLQKLDELDIDKRTLERKMALTTLRYERVWKNGLLVLDKSTYVGTTDFELEYEVQDPIEGEHVFQKLLDQFDIPKRKTPNKIRRAFQAQLKNNGSSSL